MDMDQANRPNIFKDRISEMPDEILCRVLLLLPMKERARSTILSHRWRYIWKTSLSFLLCLTLDVLSMRGSDYPNNMFVVFENLRVREDSDLLSIEKLKFVKWVYQMLQLDYSPVINSFRLRFYFNKDFSDHIDRWISVAISKRVQNFDIDLSNFLNWGVCFPSLELYTFPDWLFTQETGSLVKSLCLKSCILRPLDFNCFSSLLDLQLDNVAINQDSFDNFLSNCSNLEKLRLVKCWQLFRLKISGSCLKLNYLGVIYCTISDCIEIDAINLTRLEFWGDLANISFLNVPQLSSVIIHLRNLSNDTYSVALTSFVQNLSSHLPKLESLMLSMEYLKNPIFPSQLTKLKKLVVMITAFEGTLWGLIPLLHASPLLDTLEMNWELVSTWKDYQVEGGLVVKACDSPHHHLKNIMLSGFQGSAHEVEFTTYLLNNTKALEKIIIFYDTLKVCTPKDGYHSLRLTATRVDAATKMKEQSYQQLIKLLPCGVEILLV